MIKEIFFEWFKEAVCAFISIFVALFFVIPVQKGFQIGFQIYHTFLYMKIIKIKTKI